MKGDCIRFWIRRVAPHYRLFGLVLLTVWFSTLTSTNLFAQPCHDCVTVIQSRIDCPQDPSGNLTWHFTIRNDANFPIKYLFFLQGPSGVQVGPNPYIFEPPLMPGETREITLTLAGQYLGLTELCFRMVFYNETLNRCCQLEHCVPLPECCFKIIRESILFNPHTGEFEYTFTILNQFPAIVQYVVLVSDTPGVSIVPAVVNLVPPIGYLGTATITVRFVGASPGQTVRFRIGLLDFLGRFCCSIEHEVTIPPCCFEISEPRVDCTEDGIFYEATLCNWFPANICYAVLFPQTQGVSVEPNVLMLNPPLGYGECRRIRFRVNAGGCEGGQVCVRIVLLDCNFRMCCSKDVCFEVGRLPVRRTWTTTEDFAEGEADNVDISNDEIKLSEDLTFNYPYVWVTNFDHGTVSKIDARTYREVARYRVNSDGSQCSRTTVDRFGNVWVEVRGNNTVVQILDEQNWSPIYDLNGDGVLQTSRDLNNNGCIDSNEILPFGQDELVARVYNMAPYGNPGGDLPRALAIDQNGYLWIGMYFAQRAIQVDPNLGPAGYRPPVGGVPPALENIYVPNPYGFASSPNGFIYGTTGRSMYEFCPGDPSVPNDAQLTQQTGNVPAYGIAVGSDCIVWGANGGFLTRWDPALGSVTTGQTPNQQSTRNVAVALDGKVWTSGFNISDVLRWNPTSPPTFDASFPSCNPGRTTQSGIGVTIGGQIVVAGWLSNAPTVAFHDPTTGALLGCVTCAGMSPYVYNDFTGYQLRYALKEGTWRTVYDGGCEDTLWGRVNWNAFVPAGTSLEVRVRVSNDGQNWSPYQTVGNGEEFCLRGRYLQIEVRMAQVPRNRNCDRERCGQEFITPVLYDITASSLCECPQRGQVRGNVFCDSDRNGHRDPEDRPLSGWQIVIEDAWGNRLQSRTDHEGNYRFENIPPGEYRLVQMTLPGWEPVAPPDGFADIQVGANSSVRIDFANYLLGDVDGNQCVDDADLLVVLFAFGQAGEGLPEDINGDGVVDDADVLIVLFNFGNGC